MPDDFLLKDGPVSNGWAWLPVSMRDKGRVSQEFICGKITEDKSKRCENNCCFIHMIHDMI